MLENIALIASLICALTALTTSFRAVGVSREYSKNELRAKIKTSCRMGDTDGAPPVSQRSSLRLHLSVTLIWYVLSVIFILPAALQKWSQGINVALIIGVLLYIILAAVISLVWIRLIKTA